MFSGGIEGICEAHRGLWGNEAVEIDGVFWLLGLRLRGSGIFGHFGTCGAAQILAIGELGLGKGEMGWGGRGEDGGWKMEGWDRPAGARTNLADLYYNPRTNAAHPRTDHTDLSQVSQGLEGGGILHKRLKVKGLRWPRGGNWGGIGWFGA